MAKKKTGRKKKPAAEATIRESAEKVWLAGLGALSVAEEEGSKLFHTLVGKGRSYRDDSADATGRKVDDVRRRAGETWREVENVFDEKVAAALHRVGVPTRDEIAALTERVERLTAAISGSKPRRKRASKKSSASRGAKRATRRAD